METGAGAGDGDCLAWAGILARGFKRWLTAALCLLALVGAYLAVQRYRYRFIHSNEDLLRFLPPAETTVFFADVASLRQGGFLRLLSGAQAKVESDYRAFVRETGFDYTRDLVAVAGAAEKENLFFVLRGHFDWARLRAYAKQQGGRCEGDVCRAPASTPLRQASFRRIQPDAMALAIGGSGNLATGMQLGPEPAMTPANAPVWVRPSHALLANPSDLPVALRIFAISLQSADSVLVSLKAATAANDAFTIEVDAAFANQPAADTARTQLAIDTKMLKLALTRERRPPDPSDLTGLITSGSFESTHQHLIGSWPVRKELLQSLQ